LAVIAFDRLDKLLGRIPGNQFLFSDLSGKILCSIHEIYSLVLFFEWKHNALHGYTVITSIHQDDFLAGVDVTGN